MSNDYYDETGTPATRSSGASSPIRAEFAAVAAGFDKLPGLTGNAGKVVVVKGDETGLDTESLGGVGSGMTGAASSVDGHVVLFDGTTGKVAKSSGKALPPVCIAIACSDETTPLSTGTAKVTFISPYPSALTLTAVVASLTTAQASGNIFTVDVNEAGTTVLSTKLTIDNGEKNSSTAATAAVISDASIAAYAEITVDIDQIGDGTATGLKVYLIGHLT